MYDFVDSDDNNFGDMEMKNSEYRELMSLYLGGHCTAEQEDALRVWIESSPENLAEFRAFRNVWDAEHPSFRTDEVDVEKARRTVMKSTGNTDSPARGFRWWWRTVAAVIVLPLICWSAFLSYEKYSRPSPRPSMQKFSTPYGVYAEVVLPDSSLVCLNSGSSVTYPSFFDGTERCVRLEGEAYFRVKSDKEHPFVVTARDLEVRATGTEFNVEAYSEMTQRVTLVDGRLDVTACGRNYSIPQGYQLFRDAGNNVSCFQTDTFKWTAWRNGVLAFRGDSLSYVFERLSSLYNVGILVRDSGVDSLQIRATFRNEKIDEIMSLISRSAPVRITSAEVERDGSLRREYYIFSK